MAISVLQPIHRLRTANRAWGLLEVLTCFAVSRLAFAHLGVHFDATGLDRYWQFLPTELLRADLPRSLWYLHAQPPLFNAFLGVGLQLFGDPAAFFHGAFLALSLAMHLALFRILIALAVPRPWVVAALVLFSLNPSLATHENWLFYALWEAGLLLLAALVLVQYRVAHRPGALWLWSAAVAVLMLARAAFHPLWLLLVVALYAFSRWRKRQPLDRRVLRAILLPLLLVLLWMAKNQVLCGDFSTSSWLGMNLARVTVTALPDPLLETAIAKGDLTPFARIGPFRPLQEYSALLPPQPPTGIPALDGDNFNNLRYVTVAHALRHDSLYFIGHFPGDYLTRVGDGARIYLETTNHNAQLHDNREKLAPLEDAYNLVLRPGDSVLPMLLAVLLALIAGLHALLARTVTAPLARDDLLAAFLTGTVLWVTLAGTLLEYGENNRFRFAIDPLLLVLLLQAASQFRKPIDPAQP